MRALMCTCLNNEPAYRIGQLWNNVYECDVYDERARIMNMRTAQNHRVAAGCTDEEEETDGKAGADKRKINAPLRQVIDFGNDSLYAPYGIWHMYKTIKTLINRVFTQKKTHIKLCVCAPSHTIIIIPVTNEQHGPLVECGRLYAGD